jgi:alcohol dehydrogenase, propanol-preferring
MRAMVLEKDGHPLVERDVLLCNPAVTEILIRVSACGVCRTDLHVYDGELAHPKLPLVLGHEVVGRVARAGPGATRFQEGDRVGVPWLAWACGKCEYCLAGKENLCPLAVFTGYTRDGGYAEYTIASENFCVPIPAVFGDEEAAPLLCAGLIGYRSYAKTGDARRIGIYGFGAAAHIIAQVAKYEGREVYAFTRDRDLASQRFAREMGAVWAGSSAEAPPAELDAAIIFAPAGELVPTALKAVRRGGIVVCGGIHMSDIPSFAYELLWGERSVCSVANLTRKDAEEFMKIAPSARIRTSTEAFLLNDANQALERLRKGELRGAAVLAIACQSGAAK